MSIHTHVPVVAAAAALLDLTELLPATKAALINPLIYANAGLLGHAAFHRFLLWANVARDVVQPAVRLGRYGAETYIDGSGPFHVLTEGGLVAEYIALPPDTLPINYAHLLAARSAAAYIPAPCLMACHPGTRVWGHWLIDTLPKILLAEQAFPQRFTFVVPFEITDPASPAFLVCAILESLEAYGIAPYRLLRLRANTIYRFANLFDVVSMTADGIHPGVLAALRKIVADPEDRSSLRVMSAMRGSSDIRPIVNLADLSGVLDAYETTRIDPATTSFRQSVQAFAGSDIIVGDLGSNLAASIYARRGASIVTLAPANWRDTYFAQIFQRLGVFHADVRGMPLPQAGEAGGHSAHVIYPAHLEAAMAAARMAQGTGLPPGPIMVDGQQIARAPGRILLRISFAENGNASAYANSAFAPPEGQRSWSLGASCMLVIPKIEVPRGAFWIEMRGEGIVAPPHLVSRPLLLLVDGVPAGAWDLEELVHIHAFVGDALQRKAGNMVLEFRHPICPSPSSLGKPSGDERPLGFMFEYVALRAV